MKLDEYVACMYEGEAERAILDKRVSKIKKNEYSLYDIIKW